MWVSARCAIRRALVILRSFGLGGALRACSYSGLWGPAAPLGPVVAPLVPRCALLPAPTPCVRAVRRRNAANTETSDAKTSAVGTVDHHRGTLGGTDRFGRRQLRIGRSPIKGGWGREGVRSEA